MARKLTPEEAKDVLDATNTAQWSEWADGDLWELDCTVDLTNPTTPERAANAARHWARSNGYSATVKKRGINTILLRFTESATGRPTRRPHTPTSSKEFEGWLDRYVHFTGDTRDHVRMVDLWKTWEKYRRDYHLSEVLSGRAEPKAARIMRGPVEQYIEKMGHSASVSPLGAKLTYLYGAKIVDTPLALPTPMPSELIAAAPTPAPRPAPAAGQLPPSPFGSNQPDEAPPAPTEPAAPTIDWPALNALSVAIDELVEDEDK